MKRLTTIVIALAISCTTVFSQTYNDAVNYYNQGNTALGQSQFDQAIDLFQKSSEIFKQIDNTSNFLTAFSIMALIMFKLNS